MCYGLTSFYTSENDKFVFYEWRPWNNRWYATKIAMMHWKCAHDKANSVKIIYESGETRRETEKFASNADDYII